MGVRVRTPQYGKPKSRPRKPAKVENAGRLDTFLYPFGGWECWGMLEKVGESWRKLEKVRECWEMLGNAGECWGMLYNVAIFLILGTVG